MKLREMWSACPGGQGALDLWMLTKDVEALDGVARRFRGAIFKYTSGKIEAHLVLEFRGESGGYVGERSIHSSPEFPPFATVLEAKKEVEKRLRKAETALPGEGDLY